MRGGWKVDSGCGLEVGCGWVWVVGGCELWVGECGLCVGWG